eukprot:TRINITY_DN37848_c0_g1_i1.p1 TRINITY_DN37848_c0_g1~~TRINITY_DN37848_c0_g1_i1.p1  ORF type:complete len:275 (-),score=35.69 TRINITY_DN37848_c0_g1_i1:35-787(-)
MTYVGASTNLALSGGRWPPPLTPTGRGGADRRSRGWPLTPQPPTWFMAQPCEALRTIKPERPRLERAGNQTAAVTLKTLRQNTPATDHYGNVLPYDFRLNLGHHSDAVIGPAVGPGEVFSWTFRVTDCDPGELSFKVFAAPAGECWYQRTAGICLWAPRAARLRHDPELHARSGWSEAVASEPATAGALTRGAQAFVVLDRRRNVLECGDEATSLAAEEHESCVPIVELGALSEAKWAMLSFSDGWTTEP